MQVNGRIQGAINYQMIGRWSWQPIFLLDTRCTCDVKYRVSNLVADLDWVDLLHFGNCNGWWAATVGIFCPGSMGQICNQMRHPESCLHLKPKLIIKV